MKLKSNTIIIVFIASIVTSCGVVKYSFKDGSSKYDGNKKILITQYENNSGKGPPDMASIFTEKTKNYFMQNGDFTVTTINEDLKLECEIESYNVDYSGASSGEKAQQYKLSIAVKVTFYDYQAIKEADQKITKSITNFDFFDPSQTLSEVESDLINSISDKIIMDIFNQTVTTTDW